MTPFVRLIVPSIRTSIGKSEDPLERDGDLDRGGVYGWMAMGTRAVMRNCWTFHFSLQGI